MQKNNKLPLAVLIGVVVFIGILISIFIRGKTSQNKMSAPPAQQTYQPAQTGMQKEAITNVTLGKDGFNPKTITVKIGTRVTWMNNSGSTATVNSAPHPVHNLFPFLNLGSFENGSSVQAVFERAGTYKYHNHYSPSQTGMVIVQ